MSAQTPAEAGYAMPAEWARHTCCWMAWPGRHDTYWDIEAARDEHALVARSIARHEPVRLLVNPGDAAEARRRCLGREDVAVEIVPLPLDDAWTRDTAPTFLVDGRGSLGAVDWRFNAYGGLHDDYADTALMARRVSRLTGARRFQAPIVLEGGAVHTDGAGTLLTTEDVVLDRRRNPSLTRAKAEEVLCQYLGVHRVVWLAAALEHDATGGHIDALACFAAPGVVIALACADRGDPQYEPLRENLARLEAAATPAGRRLTVVPLTQPERRLDGDGQRISASYINSYVANGAVLVPAFGDPQDGPARETFAHLFPDLEVVQVRIAELVRVTGGIHCITQQQPVPTAGGPTPPP